jgi:hypothetical protein
VQQNQEVLYIVLNMNNMKDSVSAGRRDFSDGDPGMILYVIYSFSCIFRTNSERPEVSSQSFLFHNL